MWNALMVNSVPSVFLLQSSELHFFCLCVCVWKSKRAYTLGPQTPPAAGEGARCCFGFLSHDMEWDVGCGKRPITHGHRGERGGGRLAPAFITEPCWLVKCAHRLVSSCHHLVSKSSSHGAGRIWGGRSQVSYSLKSSGGGLLWWSCG